MTLASSDIAIIRAATNSDAAGNGGRMGSTAVASASKNNVFPDVTQAERAAGLTRWRKLFAKAANSANDILSSAQLHLSKSANGDDYITLYPAAWGDTQGTRDDGVRAYGVGVLASSVSAGATSLSVTLEASSVTPFVNGDTVWIGEAGSVNGEYHADVTVSQTGATVTITLASGDTLATGYAAGVYVASVYSHGDVQASADFSPTTAAGVYDTATYPVELSALGATEDTFTLTFTSSTAFSVSGLYAGALASGSTSADYAPTNTAAGQPYFTLRAAGFSGVWAAGDTITIATYPSAAPFWLRQVVPAGAAATAADTFELAIKGESA